MQTIVCRPISVSRFSKSNIVALLLPIPVGGVEELCYVTLDAVFQRSEAGVVAGAKQILDLGFREILILPANVLRHVDVFDLGLKTERAEQRRNQVAKAPGLAGADIEDARNRGSLHQPARHRNRIVDVDKIAALLAIPDAWPVRLEQTHSPASFGIIESLSNEAH